MIQIKETLTIEESAQAAKVSRRTIYNWIRAGLIEIRMTPSGGKRIISESLFKDGRNGQNRARNSNESVRPTTIKE